MNPTRTNQGEKPGLYRSPRALQVAGMLREFTPPASPVMGDTAIIDEPGTDSHVVALRRRRFASLGDLTAARSFSTKVLRALHTLDDAGDVSNTPEVTVFVPPIRVIHEESGIRFTNDGRVGVIADPQMLEEYTAWHGSLSSEPRLRELVAAAASCPKTRTEVVTPRSGNYTVFDRQPTGMLDAEGKMTYHDVPRTVTVRVITKSKRPKPEEVTEHFVKRAPVIPKTPP